MRKLHCPASHLAWNNCCCNHCSFTEELLVDVIDTIVAQYTKVLTNPDMTFEEKVGYLMAASRCSDMRDVSHVLSHLPLSRLRLFFRAVLLQEGVLD